MTDKTCDERRSLSVSSTRIQVPLSVLTGILSPLGGILTVVSDVSVSEQESAEINCWFL
jgi:hypothetical protein